eukprot:582445-Pelagomonas_calceolata.AAC.1
MLSPSDQRWVSTVCQQCLAHADGASLLSGLLCSPHTNYTSYNDTSVGMQVGNAKVRQKRRCPTMDVQAIKSSP